MITKNKRDEKVRKYMSNLKEIKALAEIKSKLSYQQTYKKGTWMDEGPSGKQFIIRCMETNSPVEVKSQGILQNGVQFLDVRIYFNNE